MKNDILSEYYRPLLERNNFLPIPCPEKFSPAGQCWKIEPEVGGGYYWVYGKQDLYDIKIHDFFFHEDFELDMEIPECISILRYDSISGEELSPYRRLSAGDIQTIVGGNYRYRALIHKRIPVHSVGIEILPAYYEDFLKKQYPDDYFNLPAAFQSVDQATDFPAMSKLLFEVENYRGSGMAASLFFDAKVTEAISLVVDAWKKQSQKRERPLSAEDAEGLQNVTSYIADHYAFDIPLERLANIACMSESKLKSCFKRQFGCSVTQYIRDIREAHKKDSESAPQTTVADELKENLEAVENFKGSRDEKLVVLYCKQLGINYKNLSDEEFRWLIRILKKSKKMGTPISQRKKR